MKPASASVLSFAAALYAQAPPQLDQYDLVWRTPSRDASGSMPIGNGEVGCNVWCEPDGTLHCYVSRTDSFSECSRLLKLGRFSVGVRAPAPGEPFEQRLCLREGCIRVTWGAGERRILLQLWVDSDADVIHVRGEAARDEALTVRASTWRQQQRRLRGEELAASWTMKGAPAGVVVAEAADRAVAGRDGTLRLGFMHRNEDSVVGLTLAHQGLPAELAATADILRHRMFGLLLGGDGLQPGHMRSPLEPVLLTPRGRTFALQVAAPCLQDADPAAFARAADQLLDRADPALAARRSADWWRQFWGRSWVFVDGDRPAGVPDNAHPVRIGVDSDGGNRFAGRIESLTVQPLGAGAATTLVPGHDWPGPCTFAAAGLRHGFRITATIEQDQGQPVGRILDHVTAGHSDGFLFDTHPGHSLRLIVGSCQLLAEGVAPAGRRHEVAAEFDARTGAMRLWCDGKLAASSGDDAAPSSRLTQALVLQRWVQAGGGRGEFPIKFNGSIFTVEPRHTGGQPFDADWRRWGDCFWWQNTRLPYHPMLAQGDYEMLDPLLRYYRRTLPLALARVAAWHPGARGAWWPETMTPFGTHANGDYGWERDGLPASKVQCPWWEHVRVQGLELLGLLLERWDHQRDPAFLRDELLPLAAPILEWFASAYPRDAHGRLRITPTQAVETYWHGVENDLPTVAGLHWVLRFLLALPAAQLPAALREQWRELQAALPEIPVHEVGGVRMLAPAAAFDPQRSNCESPELYAVFPFRLHGLGKPDLELARAAYAHRHDRITNGWPQDGQDAALLGLVADAQANVLAKVQNHHRAHRFPAMWGPNFDWCPDQCHGSNLLDTVQRMLLQCDGDRIAVLPCWPREWDVAFRLHAPRGTVVEVEWRGGELRRLQVEPPGRRGDVVVGAPR